MRAASIFSFIDRAISTAHTLPATLRVRELTKAEEVEFWKIVRDAKIKEIGSWIQHRSFKVLPLKELAMRLMTARWVLTWKLKVEDGKPSWGVKARLVVRGFEDFQKFTVESYSPTSSRTAQRMLMSLAARKGCPTRRQKRNASTEPYGGVRYTR